MHVFWQEFWDIFFLTFHKHVVAPSLEVPLWGTSNEGAQHMFWQRMKQNNRQNEFKFGALIIMIELFNIH